MRLETPAYLVLTKELPPAIGGNVTGKRPTGEFQM